MTTERAELLARKLLVKAVRDLGEDRMADNLENGRHPIIITSEAAINAIVAALTDAPRDREAPETFSEGLEGVPDRVLRLDALVFSDRMDFTIHHRESKEAWLPVRAGLERIKGEIDRILSDQNRCPFRPGGPKGMPLVAPPAIAPEGFVVDREAVARIIEHWAWGQFDAAVRPFSENRGAQDPSGAEQFWYAVTYQQHGFRSEEEVRDWFMISPLLGGEPSAVWVLRESLAKADAIIALLAAAETAAPEGLPKVSRDDVLAVVHSATLLTPTQAGLLADRLLPLLSSAETAPPVSDAEEAT